MAQTPEQNAWRKMHQRCYNPSERDGPHYLGNNITVCKRWHDMSAFLEDMGPKPSSGHSLDRIDNSRGYHPDNCRWATRKEQQRNTNKVVLYTVDGITGGLSELAEMHGVRPQKVWLRIHVNGWSHDDAFKLPSQHRWSKAASHK